MAAMGRGGLLAPTFFWMPGVGVLGDRSEDKDPV